MESIDTLIHAHWLIPVNTKREVLNNHSIAVQHGKIIAIEPTDKAKKHYQAQHEYSMNSHAVLPGLINAHTHASMSLMRGFADDLPLMSWLQDHIWPAEQKHVSDDFVAVGTELAMIEMLRAGTTCFNDMYFYPEVVARVALDAGMRVSVGLIVIDFPSAWARNADEYIDKGLSLFDDLKGQSLVSTVFAPHAPYTVSDKPMNRLKVMADELGRPIHTHVHETAFEVEESIKKINKRPLQHLDEMGLLSPSFMAVHMTQLTDEEIELVAERGVHVVHCPESNLKLASGFCPVDKLLSAGVNVTLGTDGAASNNDLSLFGEMRTAALLAKTVSGNAESLPAFQALEMCTINAAKALGLEDTIGSLEVGKAADIIAVDLNRPETLPVYSAVSQLVYACQSSQVSHVWVNGKLLLNDRQLCTMDWNKNRHDVLQWAQKLKNI
jgi:5-methylthioadenosine/S-adenosylhomocysteine deaminase